MADLPDIQENAGRIDIVSIVICYNNAQEVACYTDGFFGLQQSNRAFLVIVINAAREEDTAVLEGMQTRHQNVAIFDPKRNLGYMNGLLYGYREFSKQYAEIPRYVIMSNTDIEFGESGFLEKLLGKKYSSEIGCIGPSVFTKYTSNYDNPVADKRRSRSEIDRLIKRFSTPVFNWMYVYLSFVKARCKRSIKTDSRFVYEVHGCFFILTGDFAEAIKNDSYGALMYSEETYISELICQQGKKEYYDADLEVIHAEHTATRLLGNAGIAKHLSRSMKYIRDRFY